MADWDAEHPLLAHVDPGGLLIQEAALLTPGIGATPVIRTPESGLMYTYTGGGIRAVILGFVLLFFQLFPMVRAINQQVEGSSIARPLATIAGTVIRDYWQRDTRPSRAARV